ncbi:hypothetical protein [Nannocystis punicea]|uniref:Secreted protein n=1 Tax=Nannocystis punicea TaxID=2995304 RepID=A0ABY7GV67_9BACT|nr:hypothetical protein [Nannocystis poenicansa]WAS90868.1 hypothetical protein O0S08_32165 [Nannocystis poenicansa]
MRLAFAASCLLVLAPRDVTAAAPLTNAIQTGFCDEVLPRLVDVGEALGYAIDHGESGFSGASGASELRCICSEGQVAIEVADRDASVSVNFARGRSVFGLELAGQFHDFGSIQHTSILDGTADRLGGSLIFAADTADAAAFVEFDLAGQVVAADGDGGLVNERFAPVLAASTAWRDAHALMLALAGVRDADRPLSVAIPDPR